MATTVAVLEARLEANARDFERGIKGAEKQLDKLEGKTTKTGKSVTGLNQGFTKFAGLAVAGFGLSQGIRFMDQAVNAASTLDESINAVNVVFGDAADTITAFAADSTDAVFETETAVNKMATVTGSLLQNFGFNAQQAADTTVELTRRAADMASVFDVDVSEAMGAINAALRGETEQIRKFGVGVDEATVKAKALEMGLWDGTGALDQQAKVAARLNIIMEQTAKVQGDAANTADSYANQQRKLQERMADLQVELGRELLPVWLELQDAALDLIPVFSGVLDGITPLIQGVGDFASIVGGLVDLLPDVADGAEDSASGFGSFLEMVRDNTPVGELLRGLEQGASLFDSFGGSAEDAGDELPPVTSAVGKLKSELESSQSAMQAYTDRLQGQADALGVATDATENYADATRRAADPVYNAIRSGQELADTLRRIDEDGHRTTEEIAELTDAQWEANAAFENVSTEVLEGSLQNIAKFAGEDAANAVRELYESLNLLDGFTATAGVVVNIPGVGSVGGGSGGGGGAVVPGGGVKVIPGGGVAMDNGGVVPGPVGAPRMILAHGGETVLPTHKTGGGMGGGTIVIPVSIGAEHLDTIVVKGNERATRRGRL